jgi:hypothetical protein
MVKNTADEIIIMGNNHNSFLLNICSEITNNNKSIPKCFIEAVP